MAELDPVKFGADGYRPLDVFDELVDSTGEPRPAARALCRYLSNLDAGEMRQRRAAIDAAIVTMGISFTTYSDGENIDRAWPFDPIPRVMPESEWRHIDRGLRQRLMALNLFIDDLYNNQRIIKDGVFPGELLASSRNFRKQCRGISPPFGVWANICGTDLVRDRDGTVYVLEDNLRVPSGVSYMLENRMLMKSAFPDLFSACRILPVDSYTAALYDMLAALSPRVDERPVIVLLTPGIFNSAYFEHSYLAQQTGAQLVTGTDLLVGSDDVVYMKTIAGLRRVDVIYRRIDDDFLDPDVFRSDSALGVAGLMRAWAKGNVAIANAPGAGVADDKVVYTYVPKIIKYYLDQDPIIPNVPSFLCVEDNDRNYVLSNLDKLVVKPANESGGYGLLIGPAATQAERDECAARVRADPRSFMAQPTLKLSTAPTWAGDDIAARHLDMRPFVLQSHGMYVTTGGLTRVAMREGSLVVNSSQGGGSKDTWIVGEPY